MATPHVYTTVSYPTVARQHDAGSHTHISSVVITDQYTLVEFDYSNSIDSPGNRISISSNTIMVSNKSSVHNSIWQWGYKHEEKYTELKLDEWVTVDEKGQYQLYMLFPPIDASSDYISIYENITESGIGAFFWEEIKLHASNASNTRTQSSLICAQGRIIDINGRPIPNVVIKDKIRKVKEYSNKDGYFGIVVNQNDPLEISFKGYKKRVVLAQPEMSIIMLKK